MPSRFRALANIACIHVYLSVLIDSPPEEFPPKKLCSLLGPKMSRQGVIMMASQELSADSFVFRHIYSAIAL